MGYIMNKIGIDVGACIGECIDDLKRLSKPKQR